MAENLPVAPFADDLIDRIAKEVAAQVRDHIEYAYPAAARAVAWNSAALSIQGLVRNHMASAGRAADNGTIELWLNATAERRRKFKRAWKKAKGTP